MRQRSKKKDARYSAEVIEAIQPQGGISFAADPRYIVAGDGYEATVHIYHYPSGVDRYWLHDITTLDDTITEIDIGTESVAEVRKNINKSMSEQSLRYMTAKDASDVIDAQDQYEKYQRMYEDIAQLGEIVKLLHIRICVAERTKEELDKRVKDLLAYLEGIGYKASVLLNEQKEEWLSFYRSYTAQEKSEMGRAGQPILSEALAAGYPFHFTALSDPYGLPLGTTATDGNVIFDPWAITEKRMSYNGVVIGNMGTGKSTLLKKLMEHDAITGNYVRVFDVTGEFSYFAETLGGSILALDGTQGGINPLEIFKTAEDDNQSFAQHISKLSTIYRFLAPMADTYEIIEFTGLCRKLYISCGLLPENGDTTGVKLTGLNALRYPVMADLLDVIVQEKESLIDNAKTAEREARKEKLSRLDHIELIVRDLIDNYGTIFNTTTSIPNMLNEPIVIFNIKNLSGMRPEIFDAQLYNAIALCWGNCIKIGEVMKSMYENKEIVWEDITRFKIIIDEAHRIVNTNKLAAVEQLSVFCREDRKYFGGLYFASQSIRDFVPEGSDSESINKIKTLFELAQYKFILRQDSNALDLLNRVFSRQLTQAELDGIPTLEKGQAILCISGDSNIDVRINISEKEMSMLKGGA